MRETYLEWIKDYTNNDFLVDGVEEIPAMVEVVIEDMIAFDTDVVGSQDKKSESLGDYSVTFDSSDYGYSKKTLSKLNPYIKRPVKFV